MKLRIGRTPATAEVGRANTAPTRDLTSHAATLPAQVPACSKCKGQHTMISGRTEDPPLLHVQCHSCGHISIHPGI